MAFYFFSLHIPFSFGDLSVVAQILHQPVIDLQTVALSILPLQTLELIGPLLLLNYTAKPGYRFSIFRGDQLSTRRNWLLASAIGFGFLVLLVFLTSLVADILIGPKAVNNPILKEILLSSNVSEITCILVYCIVTPLLGETVYRGFLLTSLASTMKWQQAVIITSAIFSAAHFSVQALSILTLQTLELIGALLLLNYTAKPGYRFSVFRGDQLSTRRNWLLASAIGFGFLVLLVFLTSLVADILIGPKAVNSPILKEILLSSNVSEIACILVYCIVTPLLEETVYRGFLLTSLASTMKWQQAVIITSAIFLQLTSLVRTHYNCSSLVVSSDALIVGPEA